MNCQPYSYIFWLMLRPVGPGLKGDQKSKTCIILMEEMFSVLESGSSEISILLTIGIQECWYLFTFER